MAQVQVEMEQFIGKSIRESILLGAQLLQKAGAEEARHQAEQLFMHMMEVDRSYLLLHGAEQFPAIHLERWVALLTRKASGEPLQYITGSQWFYSREFVVTPAVLIPRPETELLVEALLKAVDELWPPTLGAAHDDALFVSAAQPAEAAGQVPVVPTILDVGTGSGAIAVTLAAERPGYRICASDISPDALDVARANAERHGVSRHVAFAMGDLLAPLLHTTSSGASRLEHAGFAVDVLVSNPPYIPAADIAELQREVRDHEPLLALQGGTDGLDPYRQMIETLARLSEVPRIVAFELGIYQPPLVVEMLRQLQCWDSIRIIDDYAGIQRHVIAIRYEK
ncbi:peptide chain release factor N(5)-glutamine methyltransferase [Paenibacillus yanchengensis]|uniref:Release factor glutamine methyltransferase n=1 Tax=Paenibacillus yanchengensis TaxID=2035833 RepID=A0ABW4YMW0_9BACL